MRKITLIFLISISALKVTAQVENDSTNIKLFVYKEGIIANNTSLESSQQERLFRKTQQLVNQTGITETGYSTFLVSPKFDIVSVSVDEAGMTKVYLAECELSISIERAKFAGAGGAVFDSFSENITGSGLTKSEAINNAVNNISSSDIRIVSFLNSSKQKIDKYFKMHCKDVIKQAEQALALKNYAESISLYFSIPASAPCYQDALNASEGVYTKFQDDKCEVTLTKLKAYVAMALDSTKSSYYDEAMAILNDLSPTAKCYKEAVMQIEKIEKRFDEQQKQAWEFKKKQAQDNADVKKEMYKAMRQISSNYQPSGGNAIIVVH